MFSEERATGPPGPGHVTTGLGSLDMTKRHRDLRKRGTGAVTAGSGQVTTPAGRVSDARSGTVFHRVVPAHLACRIGARTRAGERRHRRTARPVEQEPAHTEHADVSVRGHTEAATRKEGTVMPNYQEELPCPTRW